MVGIVLPCGALAATAAFVLIENPLRPAEATAKVADAEVVASVVAETGWVIVPVGVLFTVP
jgi:hypothetical protein